MILNRTPEPESHTRVVLSLGITAVACIVLNGCSGSGQTTANTASLSSPGTPATANSAASISAAPSTAAVASPGAAGTGSSDPCALLTQTDVSAAIGGPVDTGTPKSHAGAGSCVYDSTDGANAGGLIAIASWQEVTDNVKVNRITLSPLSGLGDQAFTGFAGAGFPALVVRQGNVGFEISIHGPHITSLTDHGLSKAEDLARLVLSRL
jgi:hypothetical protein